MRLRGGTKRSISRTPAEEDDVPLKLLGEEVFTGKQYKVNDGAPLILHYVGDEVVGFKDPRTGKEKEIRKEDIDKMVRIEPRVLSRVVEEEEAKVADD